MILVTDKNFETIILNVDAIKRVRMATIDDKGDPCDRTACWVDPIDGGDAIFITETIDDLIHLIKHSGRRIGKM